ncbi:MAG: DUF302 domain-containing protein [Pseudomonadota bacterium]|nr:DUF302 domain-containing protein [Pseudomonadota bacterium]
MNYHISRIIDGGFDAAIARVTEALKAEGFGVLTQIDVTATLKAKLDKDFRPYRILGACNPSLAFQALSAEDKVGVMLPCNVVVQQRDDGKIEISAIDPAAPMHAIGNPALDAVAATVRDKLQKVVAAA